MQLKFNTVNVYGQQPSDSRYHTFGHGLLRRLVFRRDWARVLSEQTPVPFLAVGIFSLERNTVGTFDAGSSIGHRTAGALGTRQRGL